MFLRSKRQGDNTDAGRRAGSAMRSAEYAPLSVIAAGVRIDGSIEAPGPLHIEGTVVGSISAVELIVGVEGRVSGDVTCRKLTVEGRVDGQVTSKEVRLSAEASMDADLRCNTLDVAAGAVLTGNLSTGARVALDLLLDDEDPIYPVSEEAGADTGAAASAIDPVAPPVGSEEPARLDASEDGAPAPAPEAAEQLTSSQAPADLANSTAVEALASPVPAPAVVFAAPAEHEAVPTLPESTLPEPTRTGQSATSVATAPVGASVSTTTLAPSARPAVDALAQPASGELASSDFSDIVGSPATKAPAPLATEPSKPSVAQIPAPPASASAAPNPVAQPLRASSAGGSPARAVEAQTAAETSRHEADAGHSAPSSGARGRWGFPFFSRD